MFSVYEDEYQNGTVGQGMHMLIRFAWYVILPTAARPCPPSQDGHCLACGCKRSACSRRSTVHVHNHSEANGTARFLPWGSSSQVVQACVAATEGSQGCWFRVCPEDASYGQLYNRRVQVVYNRSWLVAELGRHNDLDHTSTRDRVTVTISVGPNTAVMRLLGRTLFLQPLAPLQLRVAKLELRGRTRRDKGWSCTMLSQSL